MSTIMSDRGQLKLGTKSGIVRYLEDGTEKQDDITPIVAVVMLDGPDIVYVLKHAAPPVISRNMPRLCSYPM